MKKRIYIISTMVFVSFITSIILMLFILGLMRYEIIDKSFLYEVFIMENGILYVSSLIGAIGGYHLGGYWWKYVYIDKKHKYFKQ